MARHERPRCPPEAAGLRGFHAEGDVLLEVLPLGHGCSQELGVVDYAVTVTVKRLHDLIVELGASLDIAQDLLETSLDLFTL